jgi:hypothetical protein
VLVQGNMTTTGTVDIQYSPAMMDQFRNQLGSFVRVMGGWIDTD